MRIMIATITSVRNILSVKLFSFAPLLLLPLLASDLALLHATPPKSATLPQPGAPGLGDTVQPDLGNGGYDVQHYAIRIRFASDLKTYTCTSTINARATQSLSRFDLDFKGETVSAVAVNGKPVKWTRAGDELQITPTKALENGAGFVVEVSVAGGIPDPSAIKKMGTIVYGIGRTGDWVQTICQPSGARRFVALADHPAQKAPATITIAAPSRLNSIANGEIVRTWQDPTDAEYTLRQFETRQKLAPELLQIGVGPFTVVEHDGPHNIRLRHALPTDKKDAIDSSLAMVPKAIAFLEDRLGPFPLTTYGIFATPLGGGLETQSLTVLSVDELIPETFEGNGVDSVVIHEVSHEYFGNSVSPHRWCDVWLNEGHAMYYEQLWGVAQHPDSRSLEQRMFMMYQQQNKMRQQFGPVAAPKREAFPDKNLAPYGPLPYLGGALTLYALQQEIGEETFRKIERAWVQNHRDGVASTEDYIALASQIAKRDLKPFLRAWLYDSTVPRMPNHPDWTSPEE